MLDVKHLPIEDTSLVRVALVPNGLGVINRDVGAVDVNGLGMLLQISTTP